MRSRSPIKHAIIYQILIVFFLILASACSRAEELPEGLEEIPTDNAASLMPRPIEKTVKPTKTTAPVRIKPTKTPRPDGGKETETPASITATDTTVPAGPAPGGKPTVTPTKSLLLTTPVFPRFSPTATDEPELSASYTLKFHSYLQCGFNHYSVWTVKNTGEVTFESSVEHMEDLGEEILMGRESSNAPFFRQPALCGQPEQSSFEPSQTRYLFLRMSNLAEVRASSSHNIQLAVYLCTKEDQAGECVYNLAKAPVP